MLDRVLHERLQDHAGHDGIERVRADLLVDLQLRPEADVLDVEIFVDRFQLFAQRDKGFRLTEEPAQDVRQFEDQFAGGIRVHAHQ